jgi:hypothetical protein
MDKGLLIRELAEELGGSEEAVINWGVREVRPSEKHIDKIHKFIMDLP